MANFNTPISGQGSKKTSRFTSYAPVWNQQSFVGGSATDLKAGPRNSFAYSRQLDFRKKPSQISVLPNPRLTSKSIVNDLVQDMVQVADGTRYALGSNGNFYKISTSEVWTVAGAVGNGAYGLVYRPDLDAIYITSTTYASLYYPISGTPTLNIAQYGTSKSISSLATSTGGTLTYSLLTAISEGSNDKQSFTSDIEPLYSIKLNIITIGTGDWTLTLHDGLNTVLGTVTITNANLTLGLNEFVFATPVRLLVDPSGNGNGRSYHFHLTSTVADGTVAASTAGNLDTADYEIWANRFVSPNNAQHPGVNFLNFVCFGNERYLTVWEPLSDNPGNTEWQRHKLIFPPGYEVCGLAANNEFLAIATERRSTSGSKTYQDGKIFFWDGVTNGYNFFVDCPEGAPYGLHTYHNSILYISGTALYQWGGAQPVKVQSLPNSDSEYSNLTDQTFVYPHAMTIRRNVLLMGYPSQTTNQTVEHGVYSWGAVDKDYPSSFGYSYITSNMQTSGIRTNNGTNNMRIGMIKNFTDALYISWRDDSATPKYGVDIVDNTSTASNSGSYESVIFDAGAVYKSKLALRFRVSFLSLPSGAIVTPKYKLDRATNWTTGAPISTTGTTSAYIYFPSKRFHEIQVGFDITGTATTPVEVTGVALESNQNFTESSL